MLPNRARRRNSSFTRYVLAAFLVCCGAYITYDQGRAVLHGERSRAWSHVLGVVRSVEIGGASVPLGRGSSVLTATPVVRYEYWVAGEKYVSSRVNWTGFGGSAAGLCGLILGGAIALLQ